MTKEIEALWAACHIVRSGQDMSDECQLAAVLIAERKRLAACIARRRARRQPTTLVASHGIQEDLVNKQEKCKLMAAACYFTGVALTSAAFGIYAGDWRVVGATACGTAAVVAFIACVVYLVKADAS